MCLKRSTVQGWIRGKAVRLDPCIRAKVERLNRVGVVTVASCCGHGRYKQTILVRRIDGKVQILGTKVVVPRVRRFYRKDRIGFYYIPEMVN